MSYLKGNGKIKVKYSSGAVQWFRCKNRDMRSVYNYFLGHKSLFSEVLYIKAYHYDRENKKCTKQHGYGTRKSGGYVTI